MIQFIVYSSTANAVVLIEGLSRTDTMPDSVERQVLLHTMERTLVK